MKAFSKPGFTLIEILTVIAILAVVGSISVGVITVTLRTTRKSDLIETARQDSDTALTQMVKSIRYAQSLDNPLSCVPNKTVTTITITSITTKAQTIFACNAGTIQSNGASLFNTNALNVTNCQFVCQQPTLNDPPTITIEYTLKPATGGIFAETNFSLPYQASVTMRNVQ